MTPVPGTVLVRRLPHLDLRPRPAWFPFALLAAAQIAIPLTDHPPTIEWLSVLVVVGFAATTATLAVGHWGAARTWQTFGFVVLATLAVERLGVGTGFPFGDYHYTDSLQPAVDGVPLLVPVAWFAMAVPALEVGHRIADSRWGAVVVGALALTAWDLFLDPQMVGYGYWEWDVDGVYRGIPLSNYGGWLLTGLGVLAVLEARRGAVPRRPSTGLLCLYTWWSVMSTIGFAVFFHDLLVAAVGGVAMNAITVAAWRRWRPATVESPAAAPVAG